MDYQDTDFYSSDVFLLLLVHVLHFVLYLQTEKKNILYNVRKFVT